jgi:hypothetical protein
MTHKKEIKIFEKMNKNKIKIQQFEERIRHNESEGFGYMNGTYESALKNANSTNTSDSLMVVLLCTDSSVLRRASNDKKCSSFFAFRYLG